jgi:cobaltochelatase CobS
MTLVKHSERTVRRPCEDCGSTDLYIAHDTDQPIGQECQRCKVDGKYVKINRDGTAHTHNGSEPKAASDPAGFKVGDRVRLTAAGMSATDEEQDGDEGTVENVDENDSVVPYFVAMDNGHHWWLRPEHVTAVAPKPAPKAEAPKAAQSAPAAVPSDPRAAALAGLLDALSGPPMDPETVRAMVREELGAVVFPTNTVVVRGEGSEPKKIDGATHPKLGAVIADLDAGEHVLMVGPAGTGKSTIADQAAEALGLDFYSISLSPQTPTSQLVGYMQATGEYVSTLFRKAFEHGGVFHFDEFDNGHPSILATVNAALANGSMAFPDRMVKRHANFRAVASANTFGRGADRMYVGRQALDMATLDRFSVEYVDIDESLETTLCMATGLAEHTVRQVLAFTRKLRDNAAKHKMAVVISPRASVGMCRLLKAGRPLSEVIDARCRRGLSDADWDKLRQGAPSISL